ncbi:MAG: hypothetical protein PHT29_02165 [Eubacteriales bacterium]|nr:hypothetical protein [Eubacteriales bacterium]MDD3289666.1 hypothetical protein [Eubacteriales bacterium]MDD3863660.1 hypothetical protein [Eubacteriales bacterium]MDD4444254.1 hypothetical protein [Eubacteriales bacterium]
MKKILSFVLVVVLAFSLSACGGGSNVDANTEAIQTKIDQADALVQQIGAWYADNGYLEGETAEQMEEVLATLQASLDSVKVEFQAIVDAGGFTDEDVAAFEPVIDNTIAAYQGAVDELAAYDESLESGTGVSVLIEKYNQINALTTEAAALGAENGWDASEAFMSELNASIAVLELTREDLDNPSTMSAEYMAELDASFDEMIVVWQDYLAQVSVPYIAN